MRRRELIASVPPEAGTLPAGGYVVPAQMLPVFLAEACSGQHECGSEDLLLWKELRWDEGIPVRVTVEQQRR